MADTPSQPRYEDARLLTGKGGYVDDMTRPGVLHGYVLRSPHAHARIRGVDASAARAMPGVALVLTQAEYAASGLGPLETGSVEAKNKAGLAGFFPKRGPFAADKARFVGDCLAFVVADTLDHARDAAEAIDVTYEALPSNVSGARAAAGEGAALFDERPTNIAFVHEIGDEAAADAAFARAAHVVRQRIDISRVTATTMEPRGCFVDYDAASGRCTLQLAIQRVYGARKEYARIFSAPESDFRVVSGDIGGSFGMKGTGYPEPMLAVWAARQLRRPVKWMATRGEALAGDAQGRDQAVDAALALDADGKFLALKASSVANLGGYASCSPGAPVNNIGVLAGVYTTPTFFVRVTGVYTNVSPLAPYRGAGRPEAAYVIERLVDLAADKTGIDRVELRRRNMIPPIKTPYKTGLVYTYDSGEFEAVMDQTLKLADYAGFAKRREASKAAGRLRGVSIACSIERAAGPGLEAASVTISPSGDVSVVAGTTDQGQGHKTMYQQILRDRLGVDPAALQIVEGDTDALPVGQGTGGSRVSAMGGSAAARATDKVIAKARQIAAHALEVADADIEFARGKFTVVGTDRSLSLADVARLAQSPPPGIEPGLAEQEIYNSKTPNFPNGCHVCEVEVDPETGVVSVERYAVVDDVGVMINPTLVKGQIQGGITMGASQALCESTYYDPESGQLLTGSLMDYYLPRSDLLPAPQIESRPTFTATNPLGVKGVGEAGTVGALPAIMNAVIHALEPYGVRHLDMPLTPEKIWRAIRAA